MPARSALRIPFRSFPRSLFHQPGVTSFPSQPLTPIADRSHQQQLQARPSRSRLRKFRPLHSCSSQVPHHLTNIIMPKRKTTTAATKSDSAPPRRQSKRTKTATTSSSSSSSSPKMPPPKPTTTPSSIPEAKEVFARLPPSQTNRLLEPGPILLVSTGSVKDGTHNLMTLGFHSMISHSSPTLVGITLGPWDHSFALLKQTKECVLCIPNVTIAEEVVDIGNISASDLPEGATKWDRFGLEVVQGEKVGCGLVGGDGVIGNLECVVEEEGMVGEYNFWVVKVVKGWVDKGNWERNGKGEGGDKGRMMHHRGDGSFFVGGREGVLDLRGRMGKWRMLQD
ncbi:hypothetical protein QBC36DRAFT_344350 [Triangularia setosa]|uniref:Flavin reductase like domain-containing protein n=1 Tax=Triangularia setosa TaxID=2587417 RepID=A0AAN7A818_9PEZI|nr:hypothetical protein QBC36DRAFT_344350 [Podospora setosa]